jgi:hypothetical protein
MRFFEEIIEGETGKLLDELGLGHKLSLLEKETELELTELELLLIVLKAVVCPILSQYCYHDGLRFKSDEYATKNSFSYSGMIVWFITCCVNGKYIDVVGKSPEQAVFNCIKLFTGIVANKDSDTDQHNFFIEFRNNMESNKRMYERFYA